MSSGVNKLFRTGGSLKVTVFCLFYLFILTFWGTLDQVENGLFAAQQKFFTSMFFPAFWIIWLPGAKLILAIMCINLISAFYRMLGFRLKKAGILITHIGLLLFFIAAWLTYTSAVETQITLVEKETVNTSQSYHVWELSIWPADDADNKRNITAITLTKKSENIIYDLDDLGMRIEIKDYLENAHAEIVHGDDHSQLKRRVSEMPSSKNPEENLPAVFINVVSGDKQTEVDFFASDSVAKPVENDKGGAFYLALRRKRLAVPFKLRLDDFRKEFHPGTGIAKSFESDVSVDEGSGMRLATISMNKPLRIKEYTIYQASYGDDSFGRETSTFAIVKNPARILPYWASFITSFGLFLHFFLRSIQRQGRDVKKVYV